MRSLTGFIPSRSPTLFVPVFALHMALALVLAGAQGCSAATDGVSTDSGVAKGTGGVGGQGRGLGAGGRMETSGQAGSSTRGDPVDPSITFDWSVDDPTPALSCRSGHYTGSFNGTYTSAATLIGIPIPVTGDVDLRLNESSNGEFFVIENGRIKGTADKVFPYECDMKGTLNCTTKKLENGSIACTYHVLFSSYNFAGPLASSYNSTSQSFESGSWSGKEPNPLPHMGGSGTWNATWDGL